MANERSIKYLEVKDDTDVVIAKGVYHPDGTCYILWVPPIGIVYRRFEDLDSVCKALPDATTICVDLTRSSENEE